MRAGIRRHDVNTYGRGRAVPCSRSSKPSRMTTLPKAELMMSILTYRQPSEAASAGAAEATVRREPQAFEYVSAREADRAGGYRHTCLGRESRKGEVVWVFILLGLVIAGCGVSSSPAPVIDDFSRDIVRVMVPYTSRGPQGETAKGAAEKVAGRYCQTVGRKAVYASYFQEKASFLSGGKLYFLYRCAK